MICRKLIILISGWVLLLCCGCFLFPLSSPQHNNATFEGEKLARQTLNFASSPADLVVFASKQTVLDILLEIGLDTKFRNKKWYLYAIRDKYGRKNAIDSNDNVLLYRTGTDGWMNITIVKEAEGKVLLWMRKSTIDNHQPAPNGSYYKDWLKIIKDECLRQGIEYL